MTARRPALREESACALCGRREYEVVSERDRRGRPLRTVMCQACGLVWTNPRPALEEVDQYYATTYRLDYARNREPSRRKVLRGLLGAEERRQQLAPLMPPGARVLDVGCGAGEFVYLLRRRGIEADGIEPGEEYAEFSRRVLGIPIQTATVERALVEPGSRRLITMFHMLEHVANPKRTLEVVAGWLEPDVGRLVVEVPNVESEVQAPRHRFHYAHLYNFAPATLAALGKVAGLTAVETRLSPDGGNITCVFARTTEGEGIVPDALPDAVARLRNLFQRHTTVRHYLGPLPYRRALDRLRRRRREDRLLRRLRTMEAVLRWADGMTGMP